jgi:hypothetical protein
VARAPSHRRRIDAAGPWMLYGATSASVRGSIPARLRARSAVRW